MARTTVTAAATRSSVTMRDCEQCHRPFTPHSTRARYCGTNCRVAAHRARAAEEAATTAALERAALERRKMIEHHDRWATFLTANGVAKAKVEALYKALLDDHMIDGPFRQGTLW